MKALRAVGMAVALLASAPAPAVPCAGFADVDSASPFCESIAWLKNRGITVGCANGRYCPTESVSREQLAAFISRLDVLLAPYVVDASGSVVGAFMETSRGSYAMFKLGDERHALPLVPGTTPGTFTWRIDEDALYFGTPGCPHDGLGAMSIAEDVLAHTPRRVYIFSGHGTDALARYAFRTPPIPFVSVTLGTQSRLAAGVCTDIVDARTGVIVERLDNVAHRFVEPLRVR